MPGVVLCNVLEWRSGCVFRISLDGRNQRWKLSYQIIPPCQGRLVSRALLVLLCFTDVFLSRAPKVCPSFLVGCYLDQLQSRCGVTNFTCLYWFTPGVCCAGSASSKSELCSPTRMMCCFDSPGSAQLPSPGGNGQDVSRFGNAAWLENYWRDWSWLLRYLTMFFYTAIAKDAFNSLAYCSIPCNYNYCCWKNFMCIDFFILCAILKSTVS